MASKSFLTISSKECLTVYKQILINVDAKWNTANKIAELGDYGSAVSHIIISIEELMKALLIYFDGKGFYFRRVKGMDTFFKNHQIRYVIAYAIFVMAIFGDELKKFILKMRENPEYMLRLSIEIKEEDYFERKLKLPLLKKLSLLRKEFDWFSDVDISRQSGFYIDYKEELKKPSDITSEDFLKFKKNMAKVRNVAKGLIDVFEQNSSETALQLASLKKDFSQKDYYSKIENALSKLKASKESPFKLIKMQLEEF